MADAKWEQYLNDEEKQRLDLLRERMSRLLLRKFEISAEVKTMMNRAIRRERRERGKT
jgi:hypothetical protein